MEFDRLKKIIVKDILGSASGEERRLLAESVGGASAIIRKISFRILFGESGVG